MLATEDSVRVWRACVWRALMTHLLSHHTTREHSSVDPPPLPVGSCTTFYISRAHPRFCSWDRVVILFLGEGDYFVPGAVSGTSRQPGFESS